MEVSRKITVSGQVQGVGYRFFTQRVAARHQVRGYVRNLADGRVEVLAIGDRASVEAFRDDLAVGPKGSRVEHLDEQDVTPTERYAAFRIER